MAPDVVTRLPCHAFHSLSSPCTCRLSQPGGVLLPRVQRRLLNTEAEAALTLTLPLTLPPPCYFRLRRCRHCRRHRRRHRRHANAGLCLQCPVRLCRDLEILCGACLFTS